MRTYRIVHILDGYRKVNSYIAAYSQEDAVYKARILYHRDVISVTEV